MHIIPSDHDNNKYSSRVVYMPSGYLIYILRTISYLSLMVYVHAYSVYYGPIYYYGPHTLISYGTMSYYYGPHTSAMVHTAHSTQQAFLTTDHSSRALQTYCGSHYVYHYSYEVIVGLNLPTLKCHLCP